MPVTLNDIVDRLLERGMNESAAVVKDAATRIAELEAAKIARENLYSTDEIRAMAIALNERSHGRNTSDVSKAGDILDWVCYRIAELEEQLAAAQERERWIPISDGPPENIRPVLVRARNKRGECFVLRASYAHKRELEIDSDDYADGFADHDEDNGIDYCPEGWYEWNYTDEVHYCLGHLEITHWRELPAPPEQEADHDN